MQSLLKEIHGISTAPPDKPVYYIAASVKNNIKNQGLFDPGDQPINLEGLVYPGENLAIGGEAQQLQMARNAIVLDTVSGAHYHLVAR